jgi:glycosyltransferase involved in cell wall biosynthesis
MRVVYDGHIFRWQQFGGISRYFREIVSHLPDDWIPIILGEDEYNLLPRHPRLVASNICSIRPRQLSQPVKRSWWSIRHLNRAKIFHPTYYTLTGGLRYRDIKSPIIITVHDLIAAAYPALEDNAEVTVRDQREAMDYASHAICVSRATERDLHEKFPRTVGKTSVIYHGSSFPVCYENQADSIFDQPIFLYVGRRETYKNFLLLLKAFANACQSHPAIRLCVAGKPLTEDERWQIHFLGVSDRVDSAPFPSEHSLRQLYRKSVALLYPSRHEGFGIPPLEAMACGTLAVTSNTTSLPEVVGDAGIMLDPTNAEIWTDCIIAIANRKVERTVLLERGRRRASQLSWEASSRLHLETYERFG